MKKKKKNLTHQCRGASKLHVTAAIALAALLLLLRWTLLLLLLLLGCTLLLLLLLMQCAWVAHLMLTRNKHTIKP